ncbi:hypothetical protein ACN38_g1588 [Penicillium nordicum]|uniref:Uncharacterized protein n=1 Tax=Penicillium nordicum TaxID=229535 RepID=A0A0M9WJQ7_9EURO|nr:hypothetical protein ACN38_g1588 [Penicillium nordicum]
MNIFCNKEDVMVQLWRRDWQRPSDTVIAKELRIAIRYPCQSDTIEKSRALKHLGISSSLAPQRWPTCAHRDRLGW